MACRVMSISCVRHVVFVFWHAEAGTGGAESHELAPGDAEPRTGVRKHRERKSDRTIGGRTIFRSLRTVRGPKPCERRAKTDRHGGLQNSWVN